MRIRRVQPSDYPSLVECATECWSVDPKNDRADEKRYARMFFREFCETTRMSREWDFRCEVAVEADRVVGFVAFSRSRSGGWVYDLEELGVHPEFQGRGLGKRLLRHALKIIRARSYEGEKIRHVMLTTTNPIAERMYLAHGARIVERTEIADETHTLMIFAFDGEKLL